MRSGFEREAWMDERDDFATAIKGRHIEAERALLNGEPDQYLAMWSTRDPDTAMGATGSDVTTSGWDGVSPSPQVGSVAKFRLY